MAVQCLALRCTPCPAHHRMGGVAVRCLRAVKSSGRNQGWLLMSFTPPARQPYRLLRSTCIDLHSAAGGCKCDQQVCVAAARRSGKQAVAQSQLAASNAAAPTCSSLRIRSRAVTEKWEGKVTVPCGARGMGAAPVVGCC